HKRPIAGGIGEPLLEIARGAHCGSVHLVDVAIRHPVSLTKYSSCLITDVFCVFHPFEPCLYCLPEVISAGPIPGLDELEQGHGHGSVVRPLARLPSECSATLHLYGHVRRVRTSEFVRSSERIATREADHHSGGAVQVSWLGHGGAFRPWSVSSERTALVRAEVR